MTCKECKYSKFQRYNGSPNRYYCLHSAMTVGVGSRMICRTERHSEEITMEASQGGAHCEMAHNCNLIVLFLTQSSTDANYQLCRLLIIFL